MSLMNADNVLLSDFKTLNGMIPFDYFTNKDFEPAIDLGIEKAKAEVEAIVDNPEQPTFANTIVALERTGHDLNRVINVFYPLLSANSDDELMEISQRVSPKLSEYGNYISLHEGLWKRVKFVYENCQRNTLSTEDEMLLEKSYQSFARNGANLEGADREKYRELSKKISQLSLKFGQNVLKELNTYELWLTADDIDGLPESALQAAKEAAKAKGREDSYLITLQAPSYGPFMKYSTRRDLREKLYMMYNTRNTKGEYNNLELIKELSLARYEMAKLLGYKNYADYVLRQRMAESVDNVYDLLYQLRDAYTPVMKKDLKELEDFATKTEGKKMKLEAWDYSYYYNKLKDSRYALNDEMLRPYFELNNVIGGVFGLATKLYGLHFTQNFNAQVFNPEVKAFDVTDNDGKFIGIIYTDFFPRASKRSGAWMTNFREQRIDASGNNIRPIVTITMNFTRPTADKPSLLTYGEVETFLHEFGHALHGLLANSHYESLSGTNVYRDFVELPSQFNENYLSQKEFLDSFAKHYVTGESMPQELIDKIQASAQFGAAYACIRQLNYGLLDMAWHTITSEVADPFAFEAEALKTVKIFDAAPGALISTQFSHIFSGGYAAGYYGYKWAEVLDADAFAKFQTDGIFNAETARSFKENILMRGSTEHPMALYKRFRGSEPTINALLARDGIKLPKAKKKSKK
ncbi:MAG: M3 family metallopeptidase [Bacteroidales bacterium]|nr:M3 family metallopeptidase [Bacteroidales bacterium]